MNNQVSYIRVSITDRCNLRCIYCLSRSSFTPLPHSEILTYEEILKVLFVSRRCGIDKVRITGGEPLLRQGLVGFLRHLKSLGFCEMSLTTNGTLLRDWAKDLKSAGISRINVSLDTLKMETYLKITGQDSLQDALSGIFEARRVGLGLVKVNVVVMNGVNDKEIFEFVRLGCDSGVLVRFIELMPFGVDEEFWNERFYPIKKVEECLKGRFRLKKVATSLGNGPAIYFRVSGPNTSCTIGLISSSDGELCTTCNRLRLTPDGRLRPCLLTEDEVDIKGPVRDGSSIDGLCKVFRTAIEQKDRKRRIHDRPRVERAMCTIGG